MGEDYALRVARGAGREHYLSYVVGGEFCLLSLGQLVNEFVQFLEVNSRDAELFLGRRRKPGHEGKAWFCFGCDQFQEFGGRAHVYGYDDDTGPDAAVEYDGPLRAVMPLSV